MTIYSFFAIAFSESFDSTYLMQVKIAFGVPENQRLRVAQLIYEAFEKQFRTVFGSRGQSVPLISTYLRNDRTVVALYQGVVVGVGGLKFDGYGFFDTNFLPIITGSQAWDPQGHLFWLVI